MRKKRIFIILLFIALPFWLAGCSIQLGSGGAASSGGIFITTNQGDNWQARNNIPTTSGNPRSMAAYDGFSMAMDPSDNKTLYYGSIDNGLYLTYNQTSEWQYVSGLGLVTVREIAIDSADRCIVFVAIANKVYKTTDCSRSWKQIYYDNDPTIAINTIAVDHYTDANVYIGTSRGEVIKSSDHGESWQTADRFKSGVRKIVISPFDSKIVFAATDKRGVYRSIDTGENWKRLDDLHKTFSYSVNFRDLVASKSDKGTFFLATNYGLLKTVDNGNNWRSIELITPEKSTNINSLAVSPKNADELYYITNTTFYRSLDGGKNWATRKIPTSRAGWKILIDPENTKIIYLEVRTIKE
jgi:photosystem II stability/assembly factor-like uncharacterized protein